MQEAHQTLLKDLDRVAKKQKTVFSTTNSTIEFMIAELQKTRDELAPASAMELDVNAAPVMPAAAERAQPHLSRLAGTIHDAQIGQKLGTELKELHNCIAKIGKNVDKYLTADIAATLRCEPAFEQPLLNLAILQHLLKKGRFRAAQHFAQMTGITITPEMREPFLEMHQVMAHLRQGDVQPALRWAEQRRPQLEAHPATAIEFRLHRLRFVQLLVAGERTAAVQYARMHFPPFAAANLRHIQRLMAALAYAHRLEKSPYADLIAPSATHEVCQAFSRVCCAVLGFSEESALYVALTAGVASLPTHLKYAALMRSRATAESGSGSGSGSSSNGTNANASAAPQSLAVEIELPKEYQFHSVFTCPVSREQATKENPPVLLHCGHVIAKASMLKLARGGAARFKCPYCPQEQTVSQAVTLTL